MLCNVRMHACMYVLYVSVGMLCKCVYVCVALVCCRSTCVSVCPLQEKKPKQQHTNKGSRATRNYWPHYGIARQLFCLVALAGSTVLIGGAPTFCHVRLACGSVVGGAHVSPFSTAIDVPSQCARCTSLSVSRVEATFARVAATMVTIVTRLLVAPCSWSDSGPQSTSLVWLQGSASARRSWRAPACITRFTALARRMSVTRSRRRRGTMAWQEQWGRLARMRSSRSPPCRASGSK